MLRYLQRFADTYGCAVFIIDQVTAQINNSSSYMRQCPIPFDGNILAHAS